MDVMWSSTIADSVDFYEDTLGRHEQSYGYDDSRPPVHPCLIVEGDE